MYPRYLLRVVICDTSGFPEQPSLYLINVFIYYIEWKFVILVVILRDVLIIDNMYVLHVFI